MYFYFCAASYGVINNDEKRGRSMRNPPQPDMKTAIDACATETVQTGVLDLNTYRWSLHVLGWRQQHENLTPTSVYFGDPITGR